MKPRRVAVVYPPPFLDSTPCLYNLVQALADSGVPVDVYTGLDSRFTAPAFEGTVRTHFYEGSRRGFPSWLVMNCDPGKLTAIIAMDRWGMLSSAWLTRGSRKLTLVYFNVELYLPPIFTGWKHSAMNSLEAMLVRRMARLVLVPSRERGSALAQWYRLDPDRVHVLPNSPRGQATPAKRDYFQRRYGIKPDRPVLLYFGSLTSANRIEELMDSACATLPEHYVLVLHGRQQTDAEGRRWFEAQTRSARCKVVLSLDPVGPVELDDLVHSADVGIALYPTQGIGFETMGTSSGKIAQYLFSGVPVISSNVPSLDAIFREHPQAGAVVGHADEIAGAAARLLAGGTASREAAVRCFETHFSFDRSFDEFLPRFKAVTE